ncbi:tRNA epoxyqueuosine(34) reductase QueG [Aliikangiella sp. IMCC44653]
MQAEDLLKIKQKIIKIALENGFQDARVSDVDTGGYIDEFKQWVKDGYHGQMSYLERNQDLRQFPQQLHPNTLRVISLRYDYLPQSAGFSKPLLDSTKANVSRYALGRDYHKLLRKKLSSLCKTIQQDACLTDLSTRVFVDSAPVLETAFAEKSGLGWKGKHTLVINRQAGSWFFLGEIFINLALPVDEPVEDLCGSCSSCIKLCPTQAIIGPNKVDATRCISYLTIENQGEIPVSLRPKIGNRIYGCDDCQLACPWNRFSTPNKFGDFAARNELDNIDLLTLWQWDEAEFLDKLAGSPIRRIGYQNWLRNLAVAIGNGEFSEPAITLLKAKKSLANQLVNEHINWAITQLMDKTKPLQDNKKLLNCINTMLPRDA